jgi:Holliday junction resolvasome RuvABC endonuclease subunit
MILGLDISTSITGITILNDNGSIIYCDHVDMRKEKNFFKKANMIEEKLALIDYDFKINKVYIEQPFTFFKSGGSSGATMAILQKFNGVVSWQCYKIFGEEPEYLTAHEARKLVGIKTPRGSKAKKVVMDFMVDNVDDFKVQYTRYGNPSPGYADRADSYVIAKAGWLNETKETKDTS